MHQLDGTDAKILLALQTDGRIALTQLCDQLGIPHATLRDRIRKMEQAGVIEGYTAIINQVRTGYSISCFVEIVLDHQIETRLAIEALMSIEHVSELYLLTGETDVLVRIWARDIDHLREILHVQFAAIPGLLRSNALVVLGKHTKPIPFAPL